MAVTSTFLDIIVFFSSTNGLLILFLRTNNKILISLMQKRGFESDPVSNLVVGLTFYHLWYSGLPKELQWTELDTFDNSKQSEMPGDGIYKGYDAFEAGGAKSSLQCYSNTSIANGKQVLEEDVNQLKESRRRHFQPLDFYMNSAEESGHEKCFFSNTSGDMPQVSIFDTHGECQSLCSLPSSLLTSHSYDDVSCEGPNVLCFTNLFLSTIMIFRQFVLCTSFLSCLVCIGVNFITNYPY